MTPPSKRLADVAIRLSLAISPPERREWVRAMQAEVHFAPSTTAWTFALGCLWTMIRARAATSGFIHNAARWTLVAGAIAWSALHIRLAGRLSGDDAAVPVAMAYLAAAGIASGAFFTAKLGLRATAVLVTPVLVLAGVVALSAEHFLPRSPYVSLFRAIAIEYVVILLVALLIAIGVPRWIDARERRGQ